LHCFAICDCGIRKVVQRKDMRLREVSSIALMGWLVDWCIMLVWNAGWMAMSMMEKKQRKMMMEMESRGRIERAVFKQKKKAMQSTPHDRPALQPV